MSAATEHGHYLEDRIETADGWIAVCSCGWRSRKPLASRGRAWHSFNRHGCNEWERAALEVNRRDIAILGGDPSL